MRRVYCCAICHGPATKGNRQGGLGKWKCPKGCRKPRVSTNQAGAMNHWFDTSNREHRLSPIKTEFSFTPVEVKMVK